MSVPLRVDLGAVERLAEGMAAFSRHVRAIGERMEVEEGRLRTAWRGTAGDAYGQAHRRWRADADELDRAMAELRRAVATAHRNYLAAVDANRRMWS